MLEADFAGAAAAAVPVPGFVRAVVPSGADAGTAAMARLVRRALPEGRVRERAGPLKAVCVSPGEHKRRSTEGQREREERKGEKEKETPEGRSAISGSIACPKGIFAYQRDHVGVEGGSSGEREDDMLSEERS